MLSLRSHTLKAILKCQISAPYGAKGALNSSLTCNFSVNKFSRDKNGYVPGVELVGKKKREVTGMVLNYFYAVGEAIIALIAWLARDWVTLQLVISAPPLLFVSYYWLVPESVRWLLAKEKNELAKGIVCKAAEVNKVVLSEGLLSGVKDEELAGVRM